MSKLLLWSSHTFFSAGKNLHTQTPGYDDVHHSFREIL